MPQSSMMARHTAHQKNQFKKISEDYHKVHGPVLSSIYKVLQEHYYKRLAGKTVLDIGNGGQPPENTLGQAITATLKEFVGVDNSLDMLQISQASYTRIAANGFHLPFKDKSFDYVILNGVLHHLGLNGDEDQVARVQRFLKEIMRVCSTGALVYEILLPSYLEKLERGALKILKYMPTFVLSEKTLDCIITQAGFQKKEVLSKSLSALMHPFYRYIVIMDYKWLKLPAFTSPFKHTFFTIPASKE